MGSGQQDIFEQQRQVEVSTQGIQAAAKPRISNLEAHKASITDPVRRKLVDDEIVHASEASEIAERLGEYIKNPNTRNRQPLMGGSVRTFDTMLDLTEPGIGEEAMDTLIRRHNGEVADLNNDINQRWLSFNPTYKKLGVQPGKFTIEDTDAMLAHLSDEGPMPERFREYIERLEPFVRETEAQSIDFYEYALKNDLRFLPYNPAMELKKMAGLDAHWPGTGTGNLDDDMLAELVRLARQRAPQQNYFPHSWMADPVDDLPLPEGQRPGGARPQSTYERQYAKYVEARSNGQRPKFNDPLLIAVYDRMEREQFQKYAIFMKRLDTENVLKEAGSHINSPGYRVPQVGKPFEGILEPDGTRGPSWAVPNFVADYLERQDGLRPSWTVNIPKLGEKSLFDLMATGNNALKLNKFLFSLFQPVDMLKRAIQFHVTYPWNQPRYKWPILKAPVVMWDTLATYFRSSASRSGRVLDKALDESPIFNDMPELTNRMLVQEGLNAYDQSRFVQTVRSALPEMIERSMAESPKALGPFKKAADLAVAARNWQQSGLFDTFYQNLMFHMARNVEVPRQRTLHPDWSARQLAKESARVVNIRMSSSGQWQEGIIRNPKLYQMSKFLLISWNEQKNLIGGSFEAMPFIKMNTSKQSFQEALFGVAVMNAALAEGITLAATGGQEHIWDVPGMINPFSRDEESPFGYGFASQFLRPPLPTSLRGRGDRRLMVDLLGQEDTLLRLMNPKQFVLSRLSIPLRAAMNQIEGKTYFDEPMDNMIKRVVQGALDFAPIPVESTIRAAATQDERLGGAVMETEGRIGGTGPLVELSGLNISAETNPQLRHRKAKEMGLGDTYDSLEPYQKRMVRNETLEELEKSVETGVRRGQPWSLYLHQTYRLDQQQQQAMNELIEFIPQWERRDVVQEYIKMESRISTQKRQAATDFGVDFDRDDQNELESTLSDYYAISDESTTEGGIFLYEDYVEKRNELLDSLTNAQRAYILRNTNMTQVPPRLLQFLQANYPTEYARITASNRARNMHARR